MENEYPQLTTVFTEHASCAQLFATDAASSYPPLSVERRWAGAPGGYCDANDLYPRGPYSPGLFCPDGWTTASSSVYDDSRAMWIECCPSDYSMPGGEIYCSKTTTDVRVYTTAALGATSWTTYPTAVAFARPWRLIKPPETSSPSSTVTASASDTDGSGRLTTGGKAGLGVGVAIFGIISLILALVCWRRMRRRKKADDQKHYAPHGIAEAGAEPTVELPAKSRLPELDHTRQFNELDDRGIGATVHNVPDLMPGPDYYELEISPASPREVIESNNMTGAEAVATPSTQRTWDR